MRNICIRFKWRDLTYSMYKNKRSYTTSSSNNNNNNISDKSRSRTSTLLSFSRFDTYLQRRREEASKSILVQVNGVKSVPDIRSYLTTEFGSLSALYHYALPISRRQSSHSSNTTSTQKSSITNEIHWILAEFHNQSDYDKAIQSYRHTEGTLPFVSSMLWFSQASQQRSKKQKVDSFETPVKLESLKPNLDIDFKKAKSLSQQILLLEDTHKVTELGIRVRFLVASHLEQALKTLFPLGAILPFGSTVSGIGRQTGDLDLVLLPNKNEIFPDANPSKVESRLFCQAKLYTNGSNTGNARFQVQRLMETIADVIQLFVPGCANVQRILQARVPILRFWSECLDLQCDLSMTNSSGIHMSELIYIMSSLDSRFPSLLCAIRMWASSRKITNPMPGRQPTNFMLVLLLVYYLQFKKILPTWDVLFNNPDKGDTRMTADGIDCTFLRNPDKILKFFTPQNNSSSLAELLYGFFEFYSEFDFNSKGISLYTGSAWGKPDTGPMYLQNPLERHLNVARNVSKEEVVRFKNECCAALWKLETCLSSSNHELKNEGILLQDLLTSSSSSSRPTSNAAAGGDSESRLKMKELFSE